MKTKMVMVVLMLAIAWGLKRHYADARVEDLSWIITPTAYLVSAVTSIAFEWRAGEGYFSHDRMFLIEKSCAGVNFMIAAFAMLVLALLHRSDDAVQAVRIVTGALAASYASAVVVNTVRIVMALWLVDHPASAPSSLSAADAHRLEGIAVYFGGLVLLHELVRRFDRRMCAAVRTS
jgi:exosortase K